MHMYSVHIKITQHIYKFLYTAKNVPTQLIKGLPRISVLHYTQQKQHMTPAKNHNVPLVLHG